MGVVQQQLYDDGEDGRRWGNNEVWMGWEQGGGQQ